MTNSAATRSNHLQRIWFARRPPFPPRYSLPPLFVKAPFLCRYFHGTRDSQVVSHVWRELCITINLKAVNQYLNHHHPPKCTKKFTSRICTYSFFFVQINEQSMFFFFFKYRRRSVKHHTKWHNLLFHRKWWEAMINNYIKLNKLNSLNKSFKTYIKI